MPLGKLPPSQRSMEKVQLSNRLSAMGHEKVFALKGGWHAWLAEQRPVARSPR